MIEAKKYIAVDTVILFISRAKHGNTNDACIYMEKSDMAAATTLQLKNAVKGIWLNSMFLMK
jgi:hypothetical protein